MTKTSSVLTLTALMMLLSACGGGDGSSSTEETAAKVDAAPTTVVTTCPETYKSITIDRSSISGARLAMNIGGATFSFKTPASPTPPMSIKLCFGVSSDPITENGMSMLSDTYDLKVIPLEPGNSQFRDLIDPQLTVTFSLGGLPSGADPDDLQNKINVFNDAAGVLTEAAPVSKSISSVESKGTYVVRPQGEGRYVVAYKP